MRVEAAQRGIMVRSKIISQSKSSTMMMAAAAVAPLFIMCPFQLSFLVWIWHISLAYGSASVSLQCRFQSSSQFFSGDDSSSITPPLPFFVSFFQTT
jgi:hypothetical protein